jgi:hypothetical protein
MNCKKKQIFLRPLLQNNIPKESITKIVHLKILVKSSLFLNKASNINDTYELHLINNCKCN